MKNKIKTNKSHMFVYDWLNHHHGWCEWFLPQFVVCALYSYIVLIRSTHSLKPFAPSVSVCIYKGNCGQSLSISNSHHSRVDTLHIALLHVREFKNSANRTRSENDRQHYFWENKYNPFLFIFMFFHSVFFFSIFSLSFSYFLFTSTSVFILSFRTIDGKMIC